ncbi:hypothetical protein [Vreelandella venusta]|uniref:hypothetical protein n=1 Tax=Vreelandella venusta TaxID=44935 RepID=UPI003F667E39
MTTTAYDDQFAECTPEEEEAFKAIEARQQEREQVIIVSSPLRGTDEVAIFYKVMSLLCQRFKSANSIPVDSARITKEEWLALQRGVEDLMEHSHHPEMTLERLTERYSEKEAQCKSPG